MPATELFVSQVIATFPVRNGRNGLIPSNAGLMLLPSRPLEPLRSASGRSTLLRYATARGLLQIPKLHFKNRHVNSHSKFEIFLLPGSLYLMRWTRNALGALIDGKMKDLNLIVVANREPYIHTRRGNHIECRFPVSGMATALDPIMRACGGTWVAHGSGDADRLTVDLSDRVSVPPQEGSYTLRRVWLTEKQEQGYYFGLANGALWPLCHITFTRPDFRSEEWESYREVNELFARAVLQEAGDKPTLVFIQDYHFALLPKMLKEANPNLIVAQFWHIPWPNRETFRAFPWKNELLAGLLGNDLLGFHLRQHCNNFLDTVDRNVEALVDHERVQVIRGGKTTKLRPFPISIDFDLRSYLQTPATR
jgi:trehalose-6-phosphate synthase